MAIKQTLSNKVVYQIYPRSFQDTDGDGVGDLKGITSRLDYLQWLGINVIWLSPFYPSPMADFGYDVANYKDVDPLFGSLDDFLELEREANKRGIEIIIDFVLNHTSEQHPWFIESKSSKDNPKRDWYIWKYPQPDGSPPTNWQSVVSGSVWELDETTGQYYLHSFLKEQPDLNWNNPEVVEAMQDAVRFWLDNGVDGFRLDAVPFLGKDMQFRDDPEDPNHPTNSDEPAPLVKEYSWGQPEFYEHLSKIAEVTDEYNGFLVAEYHTKQPFNIDEIVKLYQNVQPHVLAPFNFSLFGLPFEAQKFKSYLDDFHNILPEEFAPMFVLGNHDEPRIASRHDREKARLLAVLLLTLPGMPFIYYGDEIGMKNGTITPDQIRDTFAISSKNPDVSRDPERTPMHWSSEINAGFSKGDPWLPVQNIATNVTKQKKDSNSMLAHYRELVALRKNSKTLRYGQYMPVASEEGIYSFKREHEGEILQILLNFTEKTIELDATHKFIFSSTSRPQPQSLAPFEGRILEIS